MSSNNLPNNGTHGEVSPLAVAIGDHAAYEVLYSSCPYCGGSLEIGHAVAQDSGECASRVRLSKAEDGVF